MRAFLALFPLGVSLLTITQALAQSPSPQLPGGVATPPAWLLADKAIPFDIRAHFAAPPDAQNAAPLYLDALFCFSPELQSCYPDSPERAARLEKARVVGDQVRALVDQLEAGPEKVDRQAVLSLFGQLQEGYQKLAAAQARPGCVFSTGIDMMALLPHVQAARGVVNANRLLVLPFLDQGQLDGTLGYLNGSLRMSRDITHRGGTIVQLVASAIESATHEGITLPILRHPRLTVAQCDAVIAALQAHEKALTDGFVEALREEYILALGTVREATGGDGPIDRTRVGELLQATATEPAQDAGLLDALARTTPAERKAASDQIHRVYRALLETAALPYAQKVARGEAAVKGFPETSAALKLARRFVASPASLAEATTRAQAFRHGVLALAAARRWQLKHNNAWPRDLAAACKEAGLPAVPVDPYASPTGPVKMGTLAGQPVIYLIGRDGKDDRGQVDNDRGRQPGDVLIKLVR